VKRRRELPSACPLATTPPCREGSPRRRAVVATHGGRGGRGSARGAPRGRDAPSLVRALTAGATNVGEQTSGGEGAGNRLRDAVRGVGDAHVRVGHFSGLQRLAFRAGEVRRYARRGQRQGRRDVPVLAGVRTGACEFPYRLPWSSASARIAAIASGACVSATSTLTVRPAWASIASGWRPVSHAPVILLRIVATSRGKPGRANPRVWHGALAGLSLPSAVIVLVGEDRRDCQSRMHQRDQHFHSPAGVVEPTRPRSA
jgi:hypothetical protein